MATISSLLKSTSSIVTYGGDKMVEKILQNFDQKNFQKNLISWFETHKRKLPWRVTEDPYAIWVSEIMLQQTKVDTVIDYYEKFMAKYPTIFELAAANEQEVLKQWEGLGYYSRARNLHHAIKEVVAEYGGQVPNDARQLSELKGIGPYTSGAILSIAFGQAEPAVDGNVMRVLSRIFTIKDNISEQKTRKLFEQIVRRIISVDDPSSFNQGLMELGALICTPTSPKCDECPVRSSCRAYKYNVQDTLPVKLKAGRPKVKKYVVIYVQDEHGRIGIEQRPAGGLLASMWQFPMIEYEQVRNHQEIIAEMEKRYHLHIDIVQEVGEFKHVFSHLIWDISVFHAKAIHSEEVYSSLKFISKAGLDKFPFSVAHLKVKNMQLTF